MINLILIRHGQSKWNAKNQFTGWVDASLSDVGKSEAKLAGLLIKDLNIDISFSYTSFLKRASDTLSIILNIIDSKNMLVTKAWELNERHYGSLTGLNKAETKNKLGDDLFNIYRRSWDIAPPALDEKSNYINSFSSLNKDIPKENIPLTESLKDTFNRVIPYYKKKILPQIMSGKKILISAHGNSLRALCKDIFNINNDKINMLEIPTGNPLCIVFKNDLKNVKNAFYLDDKRKKEIVL